MMQMNVLKWHFDDFHIVLDKRVCEENIFLISL